MLLDDTGTQGFDYYSDDELLDRLDHLARMNAMMTAYQLSVVREVEIRELAALDGHSSTGVWLTNRHRLAKGKANGSLRLARALCSMPVVSEAFSAGDISEDHVRRLVTANRKEVADVFARDEQMLVDHALNLSFREFTAIVRHWEILADPEQGDRDSQKAHDARKAHLSRVGDFFYLDAMFDLIAGAEFTEALTRIENELFQAEWAKAKEIHGAHTCMEDLERTATQRRCDALNEMARRAEAAAPGAKQPEPLVNIVIDSKTFEAEAVKYLHGETKISSLHENSICELLDGTPITPSQAMEQAIKGRISRIIFDGANQVTSVTKPTRFFTGDLRRALIIRDRTCTWPGCERPAQWCDLDHMLAVQDGGETTERNGHCECRAHHGLKHSNKFTVYRDSDGQIRHERADGTTIQDRPPPKPNQEAA